MSTRTRKLASVQTILDISSIENADRLEVATVLGWKAVVQKGLYKVNDKIIFIEIDSFLPIRQEFEFLRKQYYRKFENGTVGFRVRTTRLRGQLSQGLVMPMSLLPEGDYEIGQDVTDPLRIFKYEPPVPKCIQGLAKGNFPAFIVKTDETRAQLLQEVLNRNKGLDCYTSEKIDGSSATYYIKDEVYGVCSRNLDLKVDENPTNAFIIFGKENNIEQKLKALNKNIAIQGELYGVGINDNPLQLNYCSVAFFNVFDIDKCRYYDFEEFKTLIESLGLKTVPILDTNFKLINSIDELVKLSIAKSVINPKVWREGIVIRPLKEIMDLGMSVSGYGNSGRLSFKVVNPEFLIVNE